MADKSDNKKVDPFRLENIFKDPLAAFLEHGFKLASDKSAIVVLDTNTLLLPYSVKSNGLSKLAEVYRSLAKEKRLYLPSRAAREFIANRDKKLAEIVKALQDARSRLTSGENYNSPLLSALTANDWMKSAQSDLSKAKKEYTEAISAAIDEILGWRGNDPITRLYSTIFTAENLIEPKVNHSTLEESWNYRSVNKIPPGYKDAEKEDGGIGDFIIWESILELARIKKSHIIFITGEEKPDWVVRSNNEPVYPRPELCIEYNNASEGKSFRLTGLHQILKELDAPEVIVEQFEKAEDEQNAATSSWGMIRSLPRESVLRNSNLSFLSSLYNLDLQDPKQHSGDLPPTRQSKESYIFAKDGFIVNFGNPDFRTPLYFSMPLDDGPLQIATNIESDNICSIDSYDIFSAIRSLKEAGRSGSIDLTPGTSFALKTANRVFLSTLISLSTFEKMARATFSIQSINRNLLDVF